jgi:hypothetical protein
MSMLHCTASASLSGVGLDLARRMCSVAWKLVIARLRRCGYCDGVFQTRSTGVCSQTSAAFRRVPVLVIALLDRGASGSSTRDCRGRELHHRIPLPLVGRADLLGIAGRPIHLLRNCRAKTIPPQRT